MMESDKNEVNEQELQEILELAKETEQKAREMCELITYNSRKWRLRAKNKQMTV